MVMAFPPRSEFMSLKRSKVVPCSLKPLRSGMVKVFPSKSSGFELLPQMVNCIWPLPSFASGSYLSVQEYFVPSFRIEGGLNLRPAPRGLVLSTIHGVPFLPQAWFLSVTHCTVSRQAEPWPANRNPSVSRRPAPVWSELNQPKNAPLEPELAVTANVPEAVRLSLRVFGAMAAAEDRS